MGRAEGDGMIDFNKYFIVGTNSDALHDTMNGIVTGELIRCKDCKFNPKRIVLGCPMAGSMSRNDDSFCSVGKRRKTKDDGRLCAFPNDEMVDDDG